MHCPRLAVSALTGAAVLSAAAEAQVRWTQSPVASSPSPRNQAALVDVFLHGQMLLFGGEGVGRTPLADTWTWNGTAWQQLFPASSPGRRGGSAHAYDFVRDRVLLFSGWNGGQYEPETWEWDPTAQNWVQASPANQPQARDWGRAVFNPATNRTVLFGGHVWTLSPTQLGDTWTWDGNNWTQQTPATSPPPRFGHGMVFHPGRGTVLMFGGAVAGVGASNDFWEWNGSNWTQLMTNTQPPARTFHAMAYDALRQRVVVFGGNVGGSPSNDVWEWDGNDWSQRMPAGSLPQARAFTELVYSATSQESLMFGGATAIPRGANVADTWSYGAVQPATSGSFGNGCAGSAGVLALSCAQLAWIGESYRLDLSALPGSTFALFAMGFSDAMTSAGLPLPLSLAAFGLPCTLYVDPLVVLFVQAGPTGTASHSFALPADPALLGQVVFSQGGAVDPGATGGLTTSNACRHVLGGR